MTKLRVLVCDDEMMARKRVVRLLSSMTDVELVGECEDGAELAAAVKDRDVDVVVLDIHMPGLNGIDAAALLGDDGPAVVFCTAHAEHAVDAFALGACDYVLKPVEAARLQRALSRVRSRGQAPAPVEMLPRLAIPTRRGVVLLDPHDVTHATLDDELVTVFVEGNERQSLVTDFALSDLEERLPADRFVRVHRKALVNLVAVTRLDPVDTGGYVARLKGGHDVIVSRAAARELRRRLGLRDV
jgi:two-component system, LytTR family, response regulator